ncbi:solute carrier family 2: facilitated glucose transporter member 8-like protein, partial [Leptotrombidium deliense]
WFGSLAISTIIGYTPPGIPSIEDIHSHLQISKSSENWLRSLMPLGASLGALIAVSDLYRCPHRCKSLKLHLRKLAAFFGSGFQLWVTIGVFLVYVKGIYLPWSWLAVSNTIYPIVLLVMLCFLPESPVFLMKKKLYLEATDSLLFLFGNNSDLTNPSLYSISEEDQKVSICDFRTKEIFVLLMLCLTLRFFQQFSAINAVMFYSTDMLKSIQSVNINICVMAIAGVGVLFMFIASLLMDKAGRRLLLMVFGAIMSLSMALMALFFLLVSIKGKHFQDQFGITFLIALCTFVAAFSIGYGPIPWLLMSEYVPAKVKGLASGLAAGFNWMCAFVITQVFHYLLDLIHEQGTYLLFSIMCLLSVFFVYLKIYETKGKSLQEIQSFFKDTS